MNETLRITDLRVSIEGQIVQTGGPELAAEFHRYGYDRIRTLETP
jgi:hypothetical protein